MIHLNGSLVVKLSKFSWMVFVPFWICFMKFVLPVIIFAEFISQISHLVRWWNFLNSNYLNSYFLSNYMMNMFWNSIFIWMNQFLLKSIKIFLPWSQLMSLYNYIKYHFHSMPQNSKRILYLYLEYKKVDKANSQIIFWDS